MWRVDPVDLPPYAENLGRHLATLHRTLPLPGLAGDSRLSWLGSKPPIALGLHRPVPVMLNRLSPARRRFFRIVQREGKLRERLDELSAAWSPTSVIHGDVRSGNVLVDDRASERAVHLVDWETVQLGDPAWDPAGALQEFLLLWVRGLPADKGLSPEARVAESKVPLAIVRAGARALWRSYAAELDDREARARLLRAVAYSGAILIQSAYEWSRARDRMTVRTTLLLQLADRLLTEPEGGLDLYGLEE